MPAVEPRYHTLPSTASSPVGYGFEFSVRRGEVGLIPEATLGGA